MNASLHHQSVIIQLNILSTFNPTHRQNKYILIESVAKFIQLHLHQLQAIDQELIIINWYSFVTFLLSILRPFLTVLFALRVRRLKTKETPPPPPPRKESKTYFGENVNE